MRKTKKLSTLASILILANLILPTYAIISSLTAAAPTSVSFGSANGAPGATITVTVNANSLLTVAGYNITFTYDPTVLTANATGTVNGEVAGTFVKNVGTAGTVALALAGTEGSTKDAPGVLATVAFTVLQTANKNCALTFTVVSLKDQDGATIPGVTKTNGTFQLSGIPTGTITMTANPTSIVADGTAATTITSAAIKDAGGANVPDGTKVTVATNQGTIVATDADSVTAGAQVVTSAGVITFGLTSNLVVGNATVTANTVSGDAAGTLQVPFTAVQATKLEVTQITNPVAAGTASNVQVKAVNAAGVTATGYTGTVHFTSTDSNATLPANYTFLAGDNGVKVFTGGIILKTAGTQSVTATDTTTATITGSQTGIVVNAGAAAKINLTAQPTTIASSLISEATLTATIFDVNNNVVTAFTNPVTFAVTGVTAAFGNIKAGEASVNAVGGVAASHVQSKIDLMGGVIACTADAAGLTQGTVNVTTIPRTLVSIAISIVAGGTVTTSTPKVGETAQFKAIGTYDDTSTEDITATATWISSDLTKGDFPAGLSRFFAKAVGTTNVTATKSGKTSNAVTMTVQAANPVVINTAFLPTTVAVGGMIDFSTVISGGTGDGFNYAIEAGSPAGGTISPTGLFTSGSTAGVYTIRVTDVTSGASATYQIKQPFTVMPTSWKFLSTSVPKTFGITGVPATSTSYTWDILESATATLPVATPADYGAWSNGRDVTTPATLTNNFAPNAAVTAVKTFYVRVTIADAGLTAAGLDKVTVGPFNIIPVATYTVTVTSAAGTKLSGANVSVEYPKGTVTTKATDANGQATFNLPYTGGNYTYTLAMPLYVTQTKISNLKAVPVTLVGSSSTIVGTITNAASGAVLAGVAVSAYLPATPTVQYQAPTAAYGTYTINLPTGAATTGWTVAAAMTGFVSGSQSSVAIVGGTATANIGLTAKALGSPDANAAGGDKTLTASGQTTDVEVPAGGITTNAYIFITQAAKISTTATSTAASPTYVYNVKVTSDAAGTTPLAAADIKKIIITLPLDLGVVKPGDLEAGRYAIYRATTQATLESGNVTAIPVANIISTDYVSDVKIGSVTFWTDHLGFFSIGIAPGVSASSIMPMGNGDLWLNWANPNNPEFSGVLVVVATGVTPPFTPMDGVSYTVGQNGIVAVGPINTFLDTALENGVHRYYKIFAYDNLLHYSFPALIDGISSDTSGPSSPTEFQATAGDKEVTLGWTNPTDSDFAGVIILFRDGVAPGAVPVTGTSYNVTNTIGDAIVAYKGNAKTAVIGGLINGHHYYFSIYAFDERPNYSPAQGTVDASPIPVSIAGQVIDAGGLTPVSGATVTITNGADVFTTTTQTEGRFSFSNIPAGIYNIGFASPDYWSPMNSITVNAGATTSWNLVAIPNALITQIRGGYITQEQLNQAVVEANSAKDLIIHQRDQTIALMFTKEQLDQAVLEERIKWDVNGDGKMGLEVVISILQKMVGLR